MSDTENQLDTNEETNTKVEEDKPTSFAEELALQFANADESEKEETGEEEVNKSDETDDDTEESEESDDTEEDLDEEVEGDEETDLGIDEDLKATFKYLKKDERKELEEAGYEPKMLNMLLKHVKEQNTAYHEKTKGHSDLLKVIEPHEDALAMQGITSAQKINQYIQIEKSILANPLDGILQLANSYGVDLIKEVSSMQSNDEFVDPAMKEITLLKKEVESLRNTSTNERSDIAKTEVAAFKDAKGEDGKPLHPHFELVKGKMGELFQAGKASDLNDAYNSVVKEFGLSKQSTTTKKKEPRKSVKDAKKAASGVTSKSSASKVTTSSDISRHDELKLRLKEAGYA